MPSNYYDYIIIGAGRFELTLSSPALAPGARLGHPSPLGEGKMSFEMKSF